MMKKTISDWAKKNFLHWFTETYSFQDNTPKDFLMQLAGDEKFLSRIRIVMDGSYLRPLLVVSTVETGLPPLLLKTLDDHDLTDVAAIRRLLTAAASDEPLFLTLYFSERTTSEPFQAVVEEAPGPRDRSYTDHVLFQFELALLNSGIRRVIAKKLLLAKIDEALDERDRRKFERLAKRFKKL